MDVVGTPACWFWGVCSCGLRRGGRIDIGASGCANRRVDGRPGAVTLLFGDGLGILLGFTGKRHCWLGLVDLIGW